ncbi:hypothetical protein GQ54DRAFT_302668 [Martensiomyces pterosporus]|nr:hypothetical protein GQ54DRAFT_302668 [Martensiomyces pterosporus]
MFAPAHIHSAISQDKENAAVGSAVRGAKTGLLSGKGGVAPGHPAKLAGKLPLGQPSAANILTPSGKHQQAVRARLRDITQTPTAPSTIQRGTAPASNRHGELAAPKTIKRSQGLFSPRVQSTNAIKLQPAESFLLLEPEYAPPRPPTPEIDAVEAFGADLDTSLVSTTVYSGAGARLAELPPLDLECEEMCDIPVSDTISTGRSRIPRPKALGGSTQPKCKPVLLVAHSLHPTRIPRLKRKR